MDSISYISNRRPLSEAELVVVDGKMGKPRAAVQLSDVKGPEAVFGGARVVVWRGDITTLAVDAIVNAANDVGLGCFQEGHKCIDNVIHTAAGPRLREACRALLVGRDLSVGTEPLVTPGFFLPCRHVVHVTGPQLRAGAQPTAEQRTQLAHAYWNVLKACSAHGLSSVTLCCLSTGVFAFPAAAAAQIAMSAVRQWLESNPGVIRTIVFDTFTATDHDLYLALFPRFFVPTQSVRRAKSLLAAAPAVLLVAGAGLSAYPAGGHNVYVDKVAFARNYPDMPARGYRTAYECMGLFGDPKVSLSAKWGFLARHMHNMRFTFAPCEAYALLRRLLPLRLPLFVLTSNVDGCFARSGWENNVYTAQGDFGRVQCAVPCSRDSVFDARPLLDAALSKVSASGELPEEFIPRCPKCGGLLRPNVRGGDWFLPSVEDARQQQRLREFVEAHRELVVLEVGAGRNTPIVTRYPAEAIAREGGGARSLIRVNPDDCGVPADLARQSVSLAAGWQVLEQLITETEREEKGGERGFAVTDGEAPLKMDWHAILDRLQ